MKRRVVKQGGSLMVSIPANLTMFKAGMELSVSYSRGTLSYSIEDIPVETPQTVRQSETVRQSAPQREVPVSQPEVAGFEPARAESPKESVYVEGVGVIVDNIMDFLSGKKKKKKELEEETI